MPLGAPKSLLPAQTCIHFVPRKAYAEAIEHVLESDTPWKRYVLYGMGGIG